MDEYLGDGLYVSYDGFQLRLYTQEGNEVFLEDITYANLLRYVERLKCKDANSSEPQQP